VNGKLKAVLLVLALGLGACNLNNTVKKPYDLVTPDGKPYCGGYKYYSSDPDPNLMLRVTEGMPRVFGNLPKHNNQGFPYMTTTEIPAKSSYQQGVLPNGLVPVVVNFMYFADENDVERYPPPPPFVAGPWNAPRSAYYKVYGRLWTRHGALLSLHDPNTGQMVRASTYGWANNNFTYAVMAGPDGYVYLAGRTADSRPMGGEGYVPWDLENYGVNTDLGFEPWLAKVDPETMELVWESRIGLSRLGQPRRYDGYYYPQSLLFDPTTNSVLVGFADTRSKSGAILSVDAETGTPRWWTGTFPPASRMYWAEGGPASREVYVVSENQVCWGSEGSLVCYMLPSGLHVEKLRLPSGGSGYVSHETLWYLREFVNLYRPVRDESGRVTWVEEITTPEDGHVKVVSSAPAPEGGLNVAVQVGEIFANDTKWDLAKELQAVREDAERGYYNNGVVMILGRIGPDGRLTYHTERVMPPEVSPFRPQVVGDEENTQYFYALFMERAGRSALLLGVGDRGSACYHDKAFFVRSYGYLYNAGRAFGLLYKEGWDPGERLATPDRTPYTEYWDSFYLGYHMAAPQAYVKTGEGRYLAWRGGFGAPSGRPDPTIPWGIGGVATTVVNLP